MLGLLHEVWGLTLNEASIVGWADFFMAQGSQKCKGNSCQTLGLRSKLAQHHFCHIVVKASYKASPGAWWECIDSVRSEYQEAWL